VDFALKMLPRQRFWLLIILALLLAASACLPDTDDNRSGKLSSPPPPAGWYSLYFTQPTNLKGSSLRGGPDQSLADAIRLARASVDVAVLQLDLWSMRDALLEAHRDGVKVRMVVESDYRDSPEIQQLIEAGIPVLGDRREGLMHNKFTIIDRQEVWTGSMNYTITDGYRNNNHLVRIRSPQLAQNYTTEFEEMFVDDRFGPGSPANTPDPTVTIDGVPLEVCFAPDDGCAARLVKLLESAQESVRFLAFSFTADDLADAIIERMEAGVKVAGVMEESQVKSNRGTEFNRLRSEGAEVRLDGNPRNMHHKVLIIDERIVVFGSYNFSFFAETRNDENLIVVDDPLIAAQFLEEFEQVFTQSKP
jgi:phosphatidylserine/phosphatidylglycerophosphate/cardiolipin synthase-like enzyme